MSWFQSCTQSISFSTFADRHSRNLGGGGRCSQPVIDWQTGIAVRTCKYVWRRDDGDRQVDISQTTELLQTADWGRIWSTANQHKKPMVHQSQEIALKIDPLILTKNNYWQNSKSDSKNSVCPAVRDGSVCDNISSFFLQLNQLVGHPTKRFF